MTRYLVLEIVDESHDIEGLVETMREADQVVVDAGAGHIDVKIPPRWDAYKLGTTKPVAGNLDIYVASEA